MYQEKPCFLVSFKSYNSLQETIITQLKDQEMVI